MDNFAVMSVTHSRFSTPAYPLRWRLLGLSQVRQKSE
jgi:hypothetical protein